LFRDNSQLRLISTTHYHVSGKIKENTGLAKLYLLCRCSLFSALIGWELQTCLGFGKFSVGGAGDEGGLFFGIVNSLFCTKKQTKY